MKRVNTILQSIPSVRNFTSLRSGKPVSNQFEIRFEEGILFKSYDSNIALILNDGRILLDQYYWDYSATTGKYRNEFLREGIAETREKIESGKYKLVNLN